MILSSPPAGGLTCISRSPLGGGQMTPLDSASLSLSSRERPLPTVGALSSPLGVQGWAVGARPSDGSASTGAEARAAPAAADHMTISSVVQRNGQSPRGLKGSHKANAPAGQPFRPHPFPYPPPLVREVAWRGKSGSC